MAKKKSQNIFLKMRSLTESQKFMYSDLIKILSPRDRGKLEEAINRFIYLNKKQLDDLGVEIIKEGVGPTVSLQFVSSRYVGAVPIKSPNTGLVSMDFQVIPNYFGAAGNADDAFVKLTELLSTLEYSVMPEFLPIELRNPDQLRPPLYNVAAEYIELFEKAVKQKWHKFDMEYRNYPYPKGGTDWNKYAQKSYDPKNALIFPTKDSVLSMNHTEWQQLVYVFDLASNILEAGNVPLKIRFKYRPLIQMLKKQVENIKRAKASKMLVHSADPAFIKQTKEQANKILLGSHENKYAWRMDIAELFERYVQMVLQKSVESLHGSVLSNKHITGGGRIPKWGLRYLEPDIVIQIGENTIFADAKYKGHMVSINRSSDKLAETFRHDLHQVLAYCAFSPKANKLGLLFYPASSFGYEILHYNANFTGVDNTVILCGIPFDIAAVDETAKTLSKVIFEPFVSKISIQLNEE